MRQHGGHKPTRSMMNISFLKTFVAAFALSIACSASADDTVLQSAQKTYPIGKAPMETSVKPTLAPKYKAWSDGSYEENYLISEDFSAFTDGSTDRPSSKLLASYYNNPPGMYLDKSLMKDGQWSGTFLYSAGGAIALVSPTETAGSILNTPLGDYSGDLTITFKIKALTDSDLLLEILRGGYTHSRFADVRDGSKINPYRIYAKEGWKKVTLRVSNYSADNDGFIQWYNTGVVVIDDIEVTVRHDFIAAPKILGITDYKSSSFTANWQPVRQAYRYSVNLYKKEYTTDSDAEYSQDFEDATEDTPNTSDDWGFALNSDRKVTMDGGENGSRGLILTNGDIILSPYNWATYKQFTMWMKLIVPETGQTRYDYQNANVAIQARTLNGWEEKGQFAVGRVKDAHVYDVCSERLGSDRYYQYRFVVQSVPADCQLILDDLHAVTGRASGLKPQFSGEYYAKTYDTSYDFYGLDPYGDYYYSVRAFYLGDYSEEVLQHVFGVATPEPKDPTNVLANSYTANWNESPNATSYIVDNYGVTTVKEDTQYYPLITEDFSKVDADYTSNTDPYNGEETGSDDEESLDEVTKMPGWYAIGLTLTQGMVGTKASTTTSNYIATPEMSLGNDDHITIYVKAYGTTGDALVYHTETGEKGSYFTSQDGSDKGMVEGYFVIPVNKKRDRLGLYSLYKKAITIDELRVYQTVKAGTKIYTFLGEGTTDASTLSYDFSGWNGTFEDYAFSVGAIREGAYEYAASDMSDYYLVGKPDPTSITGIAGNASEPSTIVSVYSVDGKRLNTPQRGVNVVKMSDGSTRKLVIK